MKLSNLKISSRLGIGFGLVLALSSLIAMTSLSRLYQLNRNVESYASERVPKLLAATTWAELLLQNSLSMRDALILNDKKEIKVALDSIDENRKVLSVAQDRIIKADLSPQERALLQTMQDLRKDYAPSRLEVVEALQRGDYPVAKEAMLNKMMPVQRKYVESIKRLIEYEEAQSLVDARQANASYRSGFWLVVGLAILAVLTGTIAAFLIARSIVSQLGGEPGDAGDIAGRIAAGDLTTKISLRAGDSSSMMSAMSSMQSNLAAIVGSVRISAESVATTADQVAGATQDLSQRTEEQASSLEETASSMEELTSTVKENTGNATQANHFAQSASASAERGGVVVRQVVFTMEAITASSKRIGDIISVIDGIAFQTNILALNAAVEAARAGEQGRGFAVVASEVRSLAHRSAAAAKEIKQLIGQSVDKVELGAKQVVEAGETIDRLVADVKRVSELMGEIANASVEQGQGIDQVCQTVSQMDSVVQQNAAVVEESASAADSMRIQARHLLDAVGKFKIASRQGGSADAQAATQMRASRPGGGQLLSRPGKASAGQMKSGAGKPAKGSIGLDGDWEEF